MAGGGGGGYGNEHDSGRMIVDINVTPLVDITLVLLIIFMVTASFIVAPAVKVELPQVSKADEPPPRSLHFMVDPSGLIYLNDKKVAYGQVIHLLDLVRSGGVKKFAISVEMVRKS